MCKKTKLYLKKMFDKNFIALYQIKLVLILNKLSKLLMYKFHYDYVLNTFAKLFFTDTDSLVYETKNKKGYEQCFKDKKLFDFSGYPINSKKHEKNTK